MVYLKYTARETQLETHMGLNLKASETVRRLVDILSEGHRDVTDQAATATGTLDSVRDCMVRAEELSSPVGLSIISRHARRELDILQLQLEAQSARALRMRDEIRHIERALKID